MTNVEYYGFKNLKFEEDDDVRLFGMRCHGIKVVNVYYHTKHAKEDILLARLIAEDDPVDVRDVKADWMCEEYVPSEINELGPWFLNSRDMSVYKMRHYAGGVC